MRTQYLRVGRGSQLFQTGCRAFLVIAALSLLAGPAFSQTPTAQPAATGEVATVPTSHASVHMAAGSGSELLVMVPKGTVMPILGRKGEWVQVRLTPELRKTSIVIRWYKNEDNGWMHDSTVVISKAAPPKIEPLRFTGDIEAFEKEDKASPAPKDAIVVTGASSIRRWHPTIKDDLAPLTVIPRGFGGSTMEDALFWIDRVAIAYKPRAVVLYEGDNDTGRYQVPPEKIAGQFAEIVRKIRVALPKTRVYVIGIKLSVSRWDVWPVSVKANELLKAIADKDDLVTYIDVASTMLQPDGKVKTDIFVPDNLHLNPKGYEIWSAAVRAVLIPTEEKFEARK